MIRHTILGLAIAAMLTVAACSKPATTSEQALNRDLDLAGSPSLTLSPTQGRTDVVSAVERAPEAQPEARRSAPKPERAPRAVARHTPVRAPAAAPAVHTPAVHTPVVTEASPAPQPVADEPTSTRPRPTPVEQRRGGYKTVGEVIRDAPFPILP